MPSVVKDGLTLTRKSLHELVWLRSIRALALEYQISDVGLAKVCRRFDIPVPGLGYWRKKETGQPVRTTPLSNRSRFPADVAVITLQPRMAPTETDLVRRQQRHELGELLVPPSLSDAEPLHRLVKEARKILEHRTDITTWPSLRHGQWCLDINVFPETLDRALLIMDTLIKALEAHDYTVRCGLPRSVARESQGRQDTSQTSVSGYSTFVTVSDIDVCINLRETRKQPSKSLSSADSYLRRGDGVSSGELTLSLTDHVRSWRPSKKWIDRRRLQVENILGDVIVAIPTIAEEGRDTLRRWAQEEEERKRHALWYQEHQARLAASKRAAEAYGTQLDMWLKAQDFRAMLALARANPSLAAAAADSLELSVEDWLVGLEHQIASIDPFAEHRSLNKEH